MRSVTIRDVAREAGVSLATVSRALTGQSQVTPDTRRKVQSVADRLGYVPHGGARSLITRRTGTIGILLPDLYGEFFSELIRGIDETAQRLGFHIVLAGSHSDADEITATVRSMRGRVDGFVVMSPDLDALAVVATLARTSPTVVIGAGPMPGKFASIAVDNHDGAAAMARHLLGLGYRRLAFVGGPTGNIDASDRLGGMREVLASCADAIVSEYVGDFRQETGHALGAEIARARPLPDVVFCANDAMAVGVISAMHDAALRVPRDVAVVGFDDIPIARFLAPPLTTVRVPIAELGGMALTRLIDALNSSTPLPSQHVVVPTTLVLRASCGSPVNDQIRRSAS